MVAVDDCPIRKTEFALIVDSSFGWQNARSKVLESRVITVPFHAWWFHVTLHSEETWESVVQVTLNSISCQSVELGEWLQRSDLKPHAKSSSMTSETVATLTPAMRWVETEPLGCSGCGQASWNFWFTNDTVQPLCATCHDSA